MYRYTEFLPKIKLYSLVAHELGACFVHEYLFEAIPKKTIYGNYRFDLSKLIETNPH